MEHGEPNEKLVRVFDSKEESEAMVVRGLLESSGIATILTSPEAAQDIFPGVGGTIILVHEEQAPDAREIIASYRTRTEAPDSAA
jgi:hypothetical protein